ncbi:MAG: type II toxin-antitoxin system prevent-host-death family antitoxin [Chloroflexota bacterium]
MPDKIGVRELKNQASRILRSVREEMAEYVVTLHGEPIAMLRPLSENEIEDLHQEQVEQALAEMHALAQQVAAAWQSPLSAAEIVAEVRR